MGDKISWLGEWASQWRPPHIHHGAEQVISQSPWNGGSVACVRQFLRSVCVVMISASQVTT